MRTLVDESAEQMDPGELPEPSGRRRDRSPSREPLRELADQAFSRAAGARLVEGNRVHLLRDATQNYPAWLAAITAARFHVHFESYIIREDAVGRAFADALIAKAREGVPVRVLYDWMGGLFKASRRFWDGLRAGGVEVRCYNPPRLDSPLGWLSRDHRKLLVVDGEVGFVTGLCVGSQWAGDPARGIEPWRDTGVEIRGPVVMELERAFARMWAMTGAPLHDDAFAPAPSSAGDMAVRIVASEPAMAGMLRVDQLVAALARRRLWLTDAYFVGTPSYLHGLRTAVQEGVDVRLLVPNSTDIALLRPISRAGFRPLLEAGVRVFEWNGPMLHAKTAVADGLWARVGSTNLNVASWFGNCELDAVVEDASFAGAMERMFEADLEHATELVLDQRRKLRSPGAGLPNRHAGPRAERGSAGRAAAGALRIGNAIGSAFTSRRLLGPVESHLSLTAGLLLCALSLFFALFPKALAYPLVLLGAWAGIALLYHGHRMRR